VPEPRKPEQPSEPVVPRKFGNRSGARGILQALDKTDCSLIHLLVIGLLLTCPAIPPQTHRIDVDAQLARNLSIGSALRRR
jgi:hypothetical protein